MRVTAVQVRSRMKNSTIQYVHTKVATAQDLPAGGPHAGRVREGEGWREREREGEGGGGREIDREEERGRRRERRTC